MKVTPDETSSIVGAEAAVTRQSELAVIPSPSNAAGLTAYANTNLLALCSLTETKIAHELNLINHRVSWLASSQTFLILGLTTLISALPADPHPAVIALMIAIPIMGIIVCAQVWPAVCAAFEVLTTCLLPERATLMKHLSQQTGLPLSELGPRRYTDTRGAIPAKWIPLTFLIFWVVLLEIVFFRLFS